MKITLDEAGIRELCAVGLSQMLRSRVPLADVSLIRSDDGSDDVVLVVEVPPAPSPAEDEK